MQEASSRGDTVVSMPSLQQPLSGGGSGHCSDQDSVPSRESSPVPAAPTSPSPSPLTPTDTQTQAQLEADKRAVYKHPLFPLLALLFEKCERATQSAEVPCSESFSSDIQAFVQHQEQDRKPFFSDDPEVDGLMVKAIQVLRIHLLELEKVQELCKDFCNRYIACLKSKMQSENLLRSADFPGSGSLCEGGGSMSDTASSSSCSSPPPPAASNPSPPPAHSLVTATQIQTSATLPVIASIHGGTPLSQIGANLSASNQDHRVSNLAPRALSVSGDDEEEDLLGSKKKQKRGVLPKQATSIMRSWLFQHIVHPYPTEDEKRQIAAQTNLTLLQVNNWFINARRRILQPMLDASNPENSQQKAKKAKVQTVRPVERFWPDAIASLQPRASSHNGMAPVSSPSAHGRPSTSGTSLCSEASDDSACGGDTGHSAAEDESRDHGSSSKA
ncbi:homeobox protein PKNOX2-like isoform X2 [Dermacentor albipictus]|uniref:homeobox protein PKNOX2-like isoform X2 n=1 Tax=Dermacentor albipictus TaxID=60249 RepID=UPI0031FBE890